MNTLDIPNFWPENVNVLLLNYLNYLQKSHFKVTQDYVFFIAIDLSLQTFIEHLSVKDTEVGPKKQRGNIQ